jgi:hypothetical protein
LGSAYDALPAQVQALHDMSGQHRWSGTAQVRRGTGLVSRLVAAVIGFPEAGADVPVTVTFMPEQGIERWTRDFGGHCVSRELSARGDLVVERFGAIRFGFALPSGGKWLEMKLRRWSVLRIPLPLWLAPRIAAREWQEENGRFGFDVRVAMPLIGEVIRYTGWLCLADRINKTPAATCHAPLQRQPEALPA